MSELARLEEEFVTMERDPRVRRAIDENRLDDPVLEPFFELLDRIKSERRAAGLRHQTSIHAHRGRR